MQIAIVSVACAWLMAQQGAKPSADLPVAVPAGTTSVPPLPDPAAKAPPQTRLDRVRAENKDIPVPTKLEIQNHMGKRFRLVETLFVIDGTRALQRQAPKGGELKTDAGPLSVLVPAGPHVLTATLVFEGRNVGPFTYMDNTRYRVESTVPFTASHVDGPTTIQVVASERKGANVAFEKKPVLAVTVVKPTPEGSAPATASTATLPAAVPRNPNSPAPPPRPEESLTPARTTSTR